MANWRHDPRPMSLVEWGSIDNEIRQQTLIKDNPSYVRNVLTPSCIIKEDTDIGEE